MYGIKKHIAHKVEVYLKFLFKIGIDHPKVDVYYYPPLTEYYKEVNHYKESQFQVSNIGLGMKFYLGLMKKFCIPWESLYIALLRKEKP
jgi:hypothetical protein